MKICARCRSDQAVTNAGSIGLCYNCARILKIAGSNGAPARAGRRARVGQGSPNEGASFLPDPYAIGHDLGSKARDDATGPGSPAGGVASAVGKGADAAKEIASTVKVVAVAGVILGGAALAFAAWKAHKASEAAMSGARGFVLAHPEVLGGASAPLAVLAHPHVAG